MRQRSISLHLYRRIVLITLFAVAFIIVTGGAVRLTGSGLGCPDWPTCENDRLVAPLSLHPMVEFVNRTVTGAVSIAVIVAVLGSLFVRPRRKDLVWLSLGLIAGVIGQIVLGGLTVLFDLNPALVACHFLLSILLLSDALVLYARVKRYDEGTENKKDPTAPSVLRSVTKLMIVATTLVLMLGTVVTGSGPHGGDEEAKRFQFIITDVARIHSIAVWILVALTVYAFVLLRSSGQFSIHGRRLEWLLGVLVLQGAIGYIQYFSGIPALLVGLHIAGAVAVWVTMLWFAIGVLSTPKPAPVPAKEIALAK